LRRCRQRRTPGPISCSILRLTAHWLPPACIWAFKPLPDVAPLSPFKRLPSAVWRTVVVSWCPLTPLASSLPGFRPPAGQTSTERRRELSAAVNAPLPQLPADDSQGRKNQRPAYAPDEVLPHKPHGRLHVAGVQGSGRNHNSGHEPTWRPGGDVPPAIGRPRSTDRRRTFPRRFIRVDRHQALRSCPAHWADFDLNRCSSPSGIGMKSFRIFFRSPESFSIPSHRLSPS
jgi:hypothetical protein